MGWSDDRVETLKRLWIEGLSASQIAKQLGGVTRNAVIGKATRMNLGGREAPSKPVRTILKPTKPAAPTPFRSAASAAVRGPAPPAPLKLAGNGMVFEDGDAREAVGPPARRDAFQPLKGSTPRPWVEWEVGLCRWPIDSSPGDPLQGEPTRACCRPVLQEGLKLPSYCPTHLNTAYGSKPERTATQRAGDLARAEKARARMGRRYAA